MTEVDEEPQLTPFLKQLASTRTTSKYTVITE
jgi:hypothetical protein